MKKFSKKNKFKITKKKLIIVSALLILISVIGFSFAFIGFTNSSQLVDASVDAPIELELIVDGELTNNFPPQSVGYIFEKAVCDNDSIVTFDEENWQLDIEYIGYDKCAAYFYLPPHLTANVDTDGVNESKIPGVGYKSTVTCDGGDITWNDSFWGLEVKSLSGNTTCTISYTPRTDGVTVVDKVKSLEGQDTGDGMVVNEIVDYSYLESPDIKSKYFYDDVSNDDIYPYVWNSSTESWESTNIDYETEASFEFSPDYGGDFQLDYVVESDYPFDEGFIYLNGELIKGPVNEDGSVFLLNLSSTDVIKVTYKISSYDTSFSFKMIEGTYVDVESSAGYRYEGKNPNNYISFNEQLWRIIGVFETELSDGSSVELAKIIMDDPIGTYVWKRSSYSSWAYSDSVKLLNDYFYNATDGTNDDHCFIDGFYSNKGDCDFRLIGLNFSSRQMVESVVWKLGARATENANVETFYKAERSNIIFSGKSSSWSGKVALMYPSDYGYSVLASDCDRTTILSNYSLPNCSGNSWLFKNGYFYTLTTGLSSSNGVYYVKNSGGLDYNAAQDSYSQSPVLYLKSVVKVINGSGTLFDPYVLN